MKEAFEKIHDKLDELADEARNFEGNTLVVSLGKMGSFMYEVEAEYEQQDHTDYANIELYAFWKEHQWIPCSERLPEKAAVYEVTEEIIICSQKQYIVEHRLFGTEGEWLCPSNRKVVAWMPLPEPYKPEKGEL